MFYASTVGGGAMTSVIVRKEDQSAVKRDTAAMALRQKPAATKKQPQNEGKKAA